MTTNVTKSDTSKKSKLDEFESDITNKRNWLHLLFLIIWWPFKIILYPFIWVLREFRRMATFLTNRTNGPLDFEEIALVESTPVFFTLASVDLAIILGIIASIGFSKKVHDFINSFTNGLSVISTMVTILIEIVETILGWIYDLIVHIIIEGTWSFLTSIKLSPIPLLIGAGFLSIVIVILIMVISELNIISRIMRKLGYFGLGLAELPRAVYDSFDHFWMRFLKTFGRFISGHSVTNVERNFYRRIIVFVTLYAIWSFVWGIVILLSALLGPNASNQLSSGSGGLLYQNIEYMLIVILLSGILAGTALMFFLSKILKIITRSRYNADKTQIDEIRHKSLLDYFSTKERVASLNLADVSRLIDISKGELGSHFKDKDLKDWVLSGNAIVNDKLYKDRSKYVDDLTNKGLDTEDVKLLIKAMDYLSFMEKGLRNVPAYVDDIKDKKQLINEDIADLRGLYGGQSDTAEA